MIVCIDPGHGGVDSGATFEGVKESVFNLAIARLVAAKLLTMGYSIARTHDGLPPNVRLRNLERCKVANNASADIYVAIHCNASTSTAAHGCEVIHHPLSIRGKKLAQCVLKELSNVIKPRLQPIITDEDTGRGPYTVLRKTKAPAVIVECAFITNLTDRSILRTRQVDIAQAITKGIDAYAFTARWL